MANRFSARITVTLLLHRRGRLVLIRLAVCINDPNRPVILDFPTTHPADVSNHDSDNVAFLALLAILGGQDG